MRPPRHLIRDKTHLDTSKEFFDQEFGWIKRLDISCPKCNHENTMALLEDQGFMGCTHCSYIELLDGHQFIAGGYSEARKILESLYKESRVEKPYQARFIPMNFKRN